METRKKLVLKNDNKALKENGANEVLVSVLKLTDSKLSKYEKMILEEFLLHGKTFAEIKDVHWIVPSLQKRWFNNGLKKIKNYLVVLEDRIVNGTWEIEQLKKGYDECQIEIKKLKDEVEKLRARQKIRQDLPIEIQTLLLMPVDKLGFSPRLKNLFKKRDVYSVADLVRMKQGDFASTRNVGVKCMKDIEAFYNHYGLSWNMDI